MVKVIKNISDRFLIEKLQKIVEKQMAFIGSQHNSEKMYSAIENALKNSRAMFFVSVNEGDEYTGFAFCNICSGLETGADYLWLNEIYVEAEYRRRRIASGIIEFIEKWAVENKIKYIATMTSRNNEKSKGLFNSMKYESEDIIWIDKHIE